MLIWAYNVKRLISSIHTRVQDMNFKLITSRINKKLFPIAKLMNAVNFRKGQNCDFLCTGLTASKENTQECLFLWLSNILGHKKKKVNFSIFPSFFEDPSYFSIGKQEASWFLVVNDLANWFSVAYLLQNGKRKD